MKYRYLVLLVGALLALINLSMAFAQEFPPAPVITDEGGPAVVRGSVTYTNLFFSAGVGEPLIILEDQAGFVDRNKYFVMPIESQVIGHITSDFYTSPFTYDLSLPIVPQGSLRDVDQDGDQDTGVMILAVAFWENIWGDPYLEERDLQGGGWSTAYASTRINQDPSAEGEVIGGKYIVYAPADGQGFPNGFGEDGKLFTADDPIVTLPAGYTVVDMDADPFTFDRPREAVIDLIEGEEAQLDDFSALELPEAFDAMIEMMRREYAFTELKRVDWDALHAQFRPRFEEAAASGDSTAYLLALRDFIRAIPDGHHQIPLVGPLFQMFQEEVAGGLGMAIREVDDGRIITNFILPEGPAAMAGIELGAEILSLNGQPIQTAIRETIPWSAPFSAKHVLRLQQLRYVIRFPLGTTVEVGYRNPGQTEAQTVELTTIEESASFNFSSFNVGLTDTELPLEYRLLPSGYLYVKIYSFFDNNRLSILLWERMIQTLNDQELPGLIIDMRQNGGGSGFLSNQMAAYFFNEPLAVGNTGTYDEERGEFFFDPRGMREFYLPPAELRYNGPVAVLVGPNCASACEFFSYAMSLKDRAAIVGQYPTAGLGGSQKAFTMPGGVVLQFSVGRTVDADGNIIIEGTGVVPTVRVPVNEETLFSQEDPVLQAAVNFLDDN
ncbi:MAG: PDZ domain-containing protein [Chloroflexi bacterium]|nr:PDZ domain-containing protein [Chloroflexota bacterium]